MTVRVLHGLAQTPEDFLGWFDLSSRPLLELARKGSYPAPGVKIEWLSGRFEDGRVKQLVRSNYTQILRHPFSPEMKENGRLETFREAALRAGEKILDDAELILWYGQPRFEANLSYPISMCGGVLHYLRRRVYENDTVCLRELRPLTLIDYRSFYDIRADGEWLWEFSLKVNPGHYRRGMTPVCLPPAKTKPAKAWAQGASLEKE